MMKKSVFFGKKKKMNKKVVGAGAGPLPLTTKAVISKAVAVQKPSTVVSKQLGSFLSVSSPPSPPPLISKKVAKAKKKLVQKKKMSKLENPVGGVVKSPVQKTPGQAVATKGKGARKKKTKSESIPGGTKKKNAAKSVSKSSIATKKKKKKKKVVRQTGLMGDLAELKALRNVPTALKKIEQCSFNSY